MQAHSLSNRAADLPPFPSPGPRPAWEPDPRTFAHGEGLAHDARNLLAGMRLYADLLGRPGVPHAEHQRLASELSLIASRSSRLIDEWLNGGTVPLEDASNTTPAECLRALAPLLEHTGSAAVAVTVRMQSQDEFPAGLSASHFERLVLNLVWNSKAAMRATHPRSAVRIDLRSSGTHLQLAVADNGAGLPLSQAMRLAAPSQANGAHGRGLGVIYELASTSGAELLVTSRAGAGTRVVLRWLLAPKAGQAC